MIFTWEEDVPFIQVTPLWAPEVPELLVTQPFKVVLLFRSVWIVSHHLD